MSKREANGMRVWLRRLAPWLITSVAVLFIVQRHSMREIANEMTRGDIKLLIPIALATAVAMLVPMCWSDALVLGKLFGRPSPGDVFRGRSATAMLAVFGDFVGRGGMAVWVARMTGTTVTETVVVATGMAILDVAALGCLATAMIAFTPIDVSHAVRVLAPSVGLGLLAVLVFAPTLRGRRLPRALALWTEIPSAVAVASLLLRGLTILVMVAGTWAAARSFGLEIPLWAMLVYMPIVLLVMALPVNVGAFGPVQGAWLIFERWAPGPEILAFQMLWFLAVTIALIVRGLPFMRGVIAEISQGRTRDLALAESSATRSKP